MTTQIRIVKEGSPTFEVDEDEGEYIYRFEGKDIYKFSPIQSDPRFKLAQFTQSILLKAGYENALCQ